MKKIAQMLLEKMATGHLRGVKKWLAALALVLIIVIMLLSCTTSYKNRIYCAHGNDTTEIVYTVTGRLQKK